MGVNYPGTSVPMVQPQSPAGTGGMASMGGGGMSPVSQTGSSGGTGQFPTGGQGPLYGVKTGGFRGGRSFDNPWGYTGEQAGAARANVMAAEEEEGREREQFDWQRQMFQQRNKMFTEFLKLLQGGQSGPGGSVPMPVQPDPNIMNSIFASMAPQEQAENQALARGESGTGRFASGSTAAMQKRSNVATQQGIRRQAAFLPGQQATVAGYGPGLQARGQDIQGRQGLLQLIMQMVGNKGGMMA